MARTYARLLTSVWRDADWLALSGHAQRLYVLLLSQPRLTLVGVLDFTPSRWAKLCADSTTGDLLEAAIELEAAGFIVVDHDTDELLIRSFIHHDLTPARLNVNLLKGMWAAWEAVASEALRRLLVTLIPEEFWDHPQAVPPEDAEEMRWSDPLERTDGTDRYDGPSEETVGTAFSLKPEARTLNPSSVRSLSRGSEREEQAIHSGLWTSPLVAAGQEKRSEASRDTDYLLGQVASARQVLQSSRSHRPFGGAA